MSEDATGLENSIEYSFNDKSLLAAALTHPSCPQGTNYERLEFLGDAVLELCISRHLYAEHPNASEGELTKRRSAIVCSEALVLAARSISLGEYIRLGKGEVSTGGRDKKSILENAFEALIGAVYLDSGLPKAQEIIEKLLISAEHGKNVEQDASNNQILGQDYKSHLQEKVQSDSNELIIYKIYHTEGPPHNCVFYVRLYIGNKEMSQGKGKSKKQAEQEAAKNALAILNNFVKE